MTVLFVSYSGLLGGSERMLVSAARDLEGPAVVACPEGPLAEHARDAGLRVIPVRARRLELRATVRDRLASPLRLAGLGREVREIALAFEPGVVFGWGARGTIAALFGLRGLRARPRVVFQNNDLLKGPWVTRAVRSAARLTDRVVTPSQAIARDVDPGGVLGERVVQIRFGVDLERFRPTERPEAPPRTLVLGALVDWKRPRLGLEAAALALRELPDLHVTVAGPKIGPPGRGIAASIARRAALPDLNGRVELIEGVADPVQEFARTTCLLHCADCEPYGMVLVEALASAVPVVAPDSCGPAEIVDENCGVLYAPGDARAAARGLERVLADPAVARRLGVAGRRRAEELFDIEDTRRRYRELVGDLMRSPPPPPPAAARRMFALLTVTHDSEADLRRLLASVDRHLPGARVVVADSGSSDGSADVARGWPGGATVLELGANVGFGRACNAALEQVHEPVTVLLNPDVELLDDSLAELARELARPGRSERILTPLVLRPDGSRQDSAQRPPVSLRSALAALVPPAALPAALARRVDPWRSTLPRRAAWAVGACLAARTETLRDLGPFDERIFLFGEDLDLGLRAADRGVEIWFWPPARVLHRGAHSTEPAYGGEPFEMLARQRRAVIGERRGERAARIDDMLQALTFANRIALKTLAGRSSSRERRQLRALRAARRATPRL